MRQPQGHWGDGRASWPAGGSDPCIPLNLGEEKGVSDKELGTLVSTAFPSGHLALTWIQDPEDFKSRLPVPGRPLSFSSWGSLAILRGGLQESQIRGSSSAQGSV